MDNGFNQNKVQKREAAHEEKLPWELIEEILSRAPPQSLVRFRTVCKRWNALFDDKTFINNHKSTFRFILKTKSKIYSVSIDPEIVVRELTLNIPGLEYQIPPKDLVECGEFLLCSMDKAKGAAVWNPWLNQTSWIKPDHGADKIHGIGYDSNRTSDQESHVYKTIWSSFTDWKIHDFASNTWKVVVKPESCESRKRPWLHSTSGVALNGTLYWVAYFDNKTDPLYRLYSFEFSRERFFNICDLPCGMNDPRDALVLRVFKGDRFSLLKQCHLTKKVEIWVTKNKISVEDRDNVVWMNLLTLSISNFPSLLPTGTYHDDQPSYFIDDKRLVVCSCDESGQAWIYVVAENKLISKVQIDSVVDPWPLHCTYFPSLVPVPRGQREEEEELEV
ncbi:hypothetical protein EUTSA_v10022086mg [Eutrema salsugineum]|uniref:F-box domain-containing protein n=1 Tax=Eutrema salsugineum TaxID=72664 RepID=V4NP20_EUTSA|nr:putative F-box protein At1g47390 [Eutrema salsugineum]ESQ48276.1 hypothetical protein EUTSA_v10022086mg [Eutrema salsugineum]